jgi:glycogenin glucosyltransferase
MLDRAYVTLICSGDSYLPGVEALGRSLQASGSTVPRLAMVTADVTAAARNALQGQGWELREVAPIANPTATDGLLYPRFGNVFTKLRAWQLRDVRKAVWLDADTLVLRNIDDLFERPALAAAPDFFLPDRFNSGVMVIEPSESELQRMLQRLAESGSYDGGDQGFLNTFYADWWSMPAAHRLPMAYNTHHFIFQFLASHEALRRQLLEEVKVVHYTLQKPWRDAMVSGGSELWWKMYYRLHPEQDRGWRQRLHALEDWSFGRVVSLLGA